MYHLTKQGRINVITSKVTNMMLENLMFVSENLFPSFIYFVNMVIVLLTEN